MTTVTHARRTFESETITAIAVRMQLKFGQDAAYLARKFSTFARSHAPLWAQVAESIEDAVGRGVDTAR